MKDHFGKNDERTDPTSTPRQESGIEPGSPLDATVPLSEWESEGLLSLDTQWRVIRVNNHAEKILRRPANDVLGTAIQDLWPDLSGAMLKDRLPTSAGDAAGSLELYSREVAARIRLHIHPAADGFSVIVQPLPGHKRREEAALESRCAGDEHLHEVGSAFPVGTDLQAVEVDGETIFVGFGGDPTERRRLEAESIDLARRLVTAQEDERRRIARELHDEMGQYIAALSLGVQALEPALRDSPQYHAQLVRLKAITQHIGQDVQRIAAELRPIALDDLGFEAALANHLEEWAQTYKCSADIHCHGLVELTLPGEVETALYRVAQEGLTNVAKYARATSISVIVDRRLSAVDLIVEDNGVGFDPESLERSWGPGGHFGLIGARERVALLGGTLTIESGLGRGTALFVHIPLEDKPRGIDHG